MDKVTTKLILSARRQGQRDADDPLFAEALHEVARDPELTAWFEEEQRFDALIVHTLRQVPTPDGLKEMLLLNARTPGKAPAIAGAEKDVSSFWNHPRAKTWLAMAACVAFAFVLGRMTKPAAAPLAATPDTHFNRLGMQAIAYTSKMPALQFVCFDAGEVAQWVDKKSASMQMGKVISKPLHSMQMIGSSAAQWDGKPVIMVALQNDGRMAMLYLVRAADFPDAASGAGQIVEKDGWVSKTGRHGEHLYVLTAKGTRANLDFPMPL